MSSDCFEEVKDDQDEKEPSFTEVIVKKRHLIKKIPLTIGIVIVLLGFINMIFFWLYQIKKSNQINENYQIIRLKNLIFQ